MRNFDRPYLIFSAAIAAAIAASTGVAGAQEATQSAFALDRFQPAFAGDRMLGVPSPFVAGHLTPHAAVLVDYAHNPLVLRRDEQDLGAVVSGQLLLHLNGTFALWNRLGINLDIPVALYQNGDNPSVSTDSFKSPESAQIGDLRVGLRLRLVGEYWDPVQVALGGYIWVPTGSSDAGSYVSDGSVRGLPQIIAGGLVDERFVWSASMGIELRGAKTIANVEQGTSFQLGLGAGYLLGEEKHAQIGLEASIGAELGDPNARNTNSEILATGRYRFLNDFEVGLGVGPGLSSGQGTPSFRGVAMFAYTPEQKKPVPDQDKDGIPDAQDACPDKPGVANPDPKKNGCPPDRDGDGIPDAQDACPDKPGVANEDPKKNGCPPDRDGDGIPDAQDACPDKPGVANEDPKKNGCPPDRDGDGIIDAEDACPDVPGIADPDPKKNGCPDRDKDGIIDAQDACPDNKGEPNKDAAKNGCPDADGDDVFDVPGVPGGLDMCPAEAGPKSTDPTRNGCPVKRVVLSNTEILITVQVQFDFGRATIRPVSNQLLDEIANVIKEHPELKKLEVQGHTDNVGPAKINMKLSDDRAKAVRKALIARGIDEYRLVAKGYGMTVPLVSNDTAEGRAKNRRVQFVILEKDSVK